MCINKKTPYAVGFQKEVLCMVKGKFGLPPNAFAAPIFRLTGIRSPLRITLPLMFKFACKISKEMWDTVNFIAAHNPNGICAAYKEVMCIGKLSGTGYKAVLNIEERYCCSKSKGSRSFQLFRILGT